jgi:hypothetical protein
MAEQDLRCGFGQALTFEVLIDKYSGVVFPEMGPNMVWNVKYGHMGEGLFNAPTSR